MAWSLFGSLTNAVETLADATENVVTGIANAVSTTASIAQDGLSDVAHGIADITSDIPVVGGVVDAAATVVDGVGSAGEIVVHHFMMNVAEIGQAAGTILSTGANAAEAIVNLDLEGALYIARDGVGEIIVTDQQYIAAHIIHDIELVQIPLATVSEGVSEILAGLIGENFVSGAPHLLDDAQSLVIDAGLYESVLKPLMDGWEDVNTSVFGDIDVELSPEDMGMGYNTGDHSGHDMGMDMADGDTMDHSDHTMHDSDAFVFG